MQTQDEQHVLSWFLRTQHCQVLALVVLAALAPSCKRSSSNSTQTGGSGSGPTGGPPTVQSVSPAENPIDGLGVTLTVRGQNFNNSAEVWLDLDRPNPRKLRTGRIDSSRLAALAPRGVLTGSSFGNRHVFVRQDGMTSSQFAVLNFYFPCGEGNDSGPYGIFAGNSNGSVVLDANSDALRFRADTMQLVVDGVRLGNTRYVPSNSTVTIDDNPVARIYSVPGTSGLPVAVIGTLDGNFLRDQTRGAVDSAGERSCSTWVLRTTPFSPPTSAALGARLEGGSASTVATMQSPCPAVEIADDRAGGLTITYSNLVPGRLYLSWFGLTGATPDPASDFALMRHETLASAVPSQLLADATRHSITIPRAAGMPFSVSVTDASDGVTGCGSFARSDDSTPAAAPAEPATTVAHNSLENH